jgi:hypothetical protein
MATKFSYFGPGRNWVAGTKGKTASNAGCFIKSFACASSSWGLPERKNALKRLPTVIERI